MRPRKAPIYVIAGTYAAAQQFAIEIGMYPEQFRFGGTWKRVSKAPPGSCYIIGPNAKDLHDYALVIAHCDLNHFVELVRS